MAEVSLPWMPSLAAAGKPPAADGLGCPAVSSAGCDPPSVQDPGEPTSAATATAAGAAAGGVLSFDHVRQKIRHAVQVGRALSGTVPGASVLHRDP